MNSLKKNLNFCLKFRKRFSWEKYFFCLLLRSSHRERWHKCSKRYAFPPQNWANHLSGGPTQAQSACPHFLEKNSIKKNCCVSFEVCKKWHCRFFEASDLPQDESVRVWAFWACKKIEIRVMWTFTASKKENPCSLLRAFFCKKKSNSFQRLSFTCFPADIYTGKH